MYVLNGFVPNNHQPTRDGYATELYDVTNMQWAITRTRIFLWNVHMYTLAQGNACIPTTKSQFAWRMWDPGLHADTAIGWVMTEWLAGRAPFY